MGTAKERAPGFRVWRVACSRGQDQVRGLFGAALAAQGWMVCGFGLAKASWVKAGVLTAVHESSLKPGEHALLTQRAATIYDCGGPKHHA